MIQMYHNSHPVDLKRWGFPAGETGVMLTPMETADDSVVDVVVDFQEDDDLMAAAFISDALKRSGAKGKKRLIVPYFPYSRQDRVCHAGEAFQLKVVADFVNSMTYDEVVVFDPHSDVLPALINNAHVVRPYKAFEKAVLTFSSEIDTPLILAPDAGASKRVRDLMDKTPLVQGSTMLQALKVRRGETMEVTLCFDASLIEAEVPILIVDDICDGGATFINLANAIRNAPGYNGSPIYLFVTHGLFTKGLEAVSGYLDGVAFLGHYHPDFSFENQPIAHLFFKGR